MEHIKIKVLQDVVIPDSVLVTTYASIFYSESYFKNRWPKTRYDIYHGTIFTCIEQNLIEPNEDGTDGLSSPFYAYDSKIIIRGFASIAEMENAIGKLKEYVEVIDHHVGMISKANTMFLSHLNH